MCMRHAVALGLKPAQSYRTCREVHYWPLFGWGRAVSSQCNAWSQAKGLRLPAAWRRKGGPGAAPALCQPPGARCEPPALREVCRQHGKPPRWVVGTSEQGSNARPTWRWAPARAFLATQIAIRSCRHTLSTAVTASDPAGGTCGPRSALWGLLVLCC